MSEIEQAIAMLEIMATNLIGDVQNGNELGTMNYKAIDKAIQALQEKAEREKGCEYCNNHRPLLALYTECSIEVDDRELSVWQGLKCEETFKISFCPMCGRKLVEE